MAPAVVFHDGRIFAVDGRGERAIAEVGQDDVLWAPSGEQFAYLKQQAQAVDGKPVYHLVIRNLRGDSINEFAIYRPGVPSQLEWLDDERLSYQAPEDRSGNLYVIHDARTAAVLQIYWGSQFVWSPGRSRLAYVHGASATPEIRIDGSPIWPRGRRADRGRRIVGNLAWSPDGHGLAFMEQRRRDAQLVVMLEIDNETGDLSWKLPAGVTERDNKLFWVDSKVLIGKDMLAPRFAASWNREQ